LKRQIHRWLDTVQRLAPESVRAAVRAPYLRHIYFPLYPHKRPSRAVHSDYPPMLDFKWRLTGALPLHFEALRVACQPGLVSVVLPVYNGARYLRESLANVLGQSYRNLELIVVDDASSDATPDILAEFAAQDARVRVLRQPRNRRLPAALNAGFDAARGEYFTWTSDDNRMRPGMLAALAGFLSRHPDTEMIFADEQLIGEEGAPARDLDFCPHFQHPPGSGAIRWPRDPGRLNFVNENFIGGCFLYRAWTARVLGPYDERCFGFEDYDYWLRMNALFRIRHLDTDEPLYDYRVHPRSLTARKAELATVERVNDFWPREAERRAFFLEPFEIRYHGDHRWFDAMRQALPSVPGSRKTLDVAAAEDGMRLPGGAVLHAPNPWPVLYPLLAAANSHLWRTQRS
jgi:glycosyltransferase involved in cell wall biosynthesis